MASRFDEDTRRVIRKIACRLSDNRAIREDLESAATIAVLEAEPDYDPDAGVDWLLYAYRVAWGRAWADIRRERRRIAHKQLHSNMASSDVPEPDDLTVGLMRSTLNDIEARAVQLVCGLGGRERSYGEVAWIERRSKRRVYVHYLRAVEKLRQRLGSLAG